MTRLIELGGNDGELGAQYGALAAREIREAVGVYRAGFEQVSPDFVALAEDKAGHYAAQIKAVTPHLARQIDATADAAGVAREWLYILNARSELMASFVPECTALYSPRSAHLAQNWDFNPDLADLTVLLKIDLGDQREILTLTEAGMVGKIGLNSDGIGVCLNMLLSAAPITGLPIHILLRWLLEARDREEIEARLAAAGPSRAGNIMIGHASGWGVNMEYSGDEVRRDELRQDNFVHTNHVLDDTTGEADFLHNSRMRCQQVSEKVADGSGLDRAQIDALLSDQSNDDHPIHVPNRTMNGMTFGTLYSIIMDLPQRSLHLRKGPDTTQPYTSYQLQSQAIAAE